VTPRSPWDSGLAAHAHIEWSFPLKAEAPRGLVKLTGTHSEVEHDPSTAVTLKLINTFSNST